MLKKGSRFLLHLFLFIICAALFTAICLLIVRPPADSAGSSSAVAADFPDYAPDFTSGQPAALARAFSHPLPVLSGESFEGRVSSVPFEGRHALMATLHYGTFTLQCVQPAQAAPLLLNAELSPASVRTDSAAPFSILSMPAIYAYEGSRHIFYFSDDSAAYSLYSDQLDLSGLAYIASCLKWVT